MRCSMMALQQHLTLVTTVSLKNPAVQERLPRLRYTDLMMGLEREIHQKEEGQRNQRGRQRQRVISARRAARVSGGGWDGLPGTSAISCCSNWQPLGRACSMDLR